MSGAVILDMHVAEQRAQCLQGNLVLKTLLESCSLQELAVMNLVNKRIHVAIYRDALGHVNRLLLERVVVGHTFLAKSVTEQFKILNNPSEFHCLPFRIRFKVKHRIQIRDICLRCHKPSITAKDIKNRCFALVNKPVSRVSVIVSGIAISNETRLFPAEDVKEGEERDREQGDSFPRNNRTRPCLIS